MKDSKISLHLYPVCRKRRLRRHSREVEEPPPLKYFPKKCQSRKKEEREEVIFKPLVYFCLGTDYSVMNKNSLEICVYACILEEHLNTGIKGETIEVL